MGVFPKGRNIYFGIREHAMASITNAIALYGHLMPFSSTFFVFSDYLKPAARIAALSGIQHFFIWTHDSIGVGEDGPTHQPIEHVSSLRMIPGLSVWRPADYMETGYSYVAAFEKTDGPSVMVLTRQNLPKLDGVNENVKKGGYILSKEEKATPDAILMGSGSEVSLLVEAKKVLKEKGLDVRVVSMPNMNVFEMQSKEYKEEVLPSNVEARVSVEAGVTMPWYRYLGNKGTAIGIDTFGASAPIEKLMEHFGFSVDNVVDKTLEVVK